MRSSSKCFLLFCIKFHLQQTPPTAPLPLSRERFIVNWNSCCCWFGGHFVHFSLYFRFENAIELDSFFSLCSNFISDYCYFYMAFKLCCLTSSLSYLSLFTGATQLLVHIISNHPSIHSSLYSSLFITIHSSDRTSIAFWWKNLTSSSQEFVLGTISFYIEITPN